MKYKAYPKYKSSGIEWIGDVPEHWEVKRLKYVASVNDEVLPENTPPDQEILYVDIGSIDRIEGITKKEPMIFEDAPSRARRLVAHGDTIVSTVRTYLKAIAPVQNPEPNLVVSTGFAVIRPRNVESEFLSFLLRSSYFVENVVSRSVGVSYPATNASEVTKIPILQSNASEQRNIGDFLDRETEKIDTLVAKKQALIEKLKEKRTALISRTVTRGLPPEAARAAGLDPHPKLKLSGVEWLGGVPEHWQITTIGYQFRNLDHRRIPVAGEVRAVAEKIYPYYGASGIIDYIDDYLFDEPLILVAEDGANLLSRSTPLAFLASGKYWVNNHAHILRPLSGDIRYWVGVLQTFDYTPLITGAAQPKLTTDHLSSIKIPLPPTTEQRTIADHLDRETFKIEKLVAKVEAAIERLQEYRTALITAAVTGKIDVRGVNA